MMSARTLGCLTNVSLALSSRWQTGGTRTGVLDNMSQSGIQGLQKAPPGMTPEQAVAHLTSTDPRFEMAEADIRGVRYRVFRNAPPHMRALLQTSARAHGEKPALVYQDERWTYAEFCSEVNRLANAMVDTLGVRPGDRVGLAMRNYPELPILIFAVAAMGGVVVPLNSWWSEAELAYALEDCGAKVVFADEPRYQRIQPCVASLGIKLIAVRDAQGSRNYADLRDSAAGDDWPNVPIEADDDFAILYSSGSTGHPKGVVLTHRSTVSAVHSWTLARAVSMLVTGPPALAPRSPSWMVATPLFHVTALQSVFLQGLAIGAKMSLLYKWDPEQAIRVIQAEEVTRFSGVPTQSAELMDAAQRLQISLASLENIGAGGAKAPAAQVGRLAKAFPGKVVAAGWGMTETNALGITIAGPEYVENPESIGRPTPALQEIRVVDADGNALPAGEVGELIVRSPANMRCYLNQPDATAAVLRDGWLYTGDLARVDKTGLFYIVDRMKNIIIRGGENISCLDVEGALHRHPGVAEACVFSVPDQRLGEIVGAGVQLRPGADVTVAELAEFLAEHIAQFKIPERIWFWPDSLPRGATGKLDRRALRKECLERDDVAATEVI